MCLILSQVHSTTLAHQHRVSDFLLGLDILLIRIVRKRIQKKTQSHPKIRRREEKQYDSISHYKERELRLLLSKDDDDKSPLL